MTMAGMASRKQPTTRKQKADEEAAAIGPMPQVETLASSSCGSCSKPIASRRRSRYRCRTARRRRDVRCPATPVELARAGFTVKNVESATNEHRDAGGLGRGERSPAMPPTMMNASSAPVSTARSPTTCPPAILRIGRIAAAHASTCTVAICAPAISRPGTMPARYIAAIEVESAAHTIIRIRDDHGEHGRDRGDGDGEREVVALLVCASMKILTGSASAVEEPEMPAKNTDSTTLICASDPANARPSSATTRPGGR